jgi:dolichol-phosphate mannosyltransferase
LNEEEVLETLYQRVTDTLSRLAITYEVIVIDDGSTDRTWAIFREIHQRDPRWKGLQLGRNFGHQIALRAGLEVTTGDVVGIIDADLQDPPEILGEMLKRWQEGDDVVVGVRRRRKEGPFKRSMYFLFYRVLSLLAELRLPLDAGDFCVMDGSVVSVIRQMPERRPFIRGLRSYVGFRQSLFPYERAARHAGTTKYSYWKLLKLAADGILSNSRAPLHFATLLGAAAALVAFFAAILTLSIGLFPAIFARLGIHYVQGTASIIIAVLFMGGIQLMCLGIIGAYLGRIHENVMQRPNWSVRSVVGLADPHTPAEKNKA